MRGSVNVPAHSEFDAKKHTGNKKNPHGVTKEQIGLGKVDNTSDMEKPVSTAQQKAIETAVQNIGSGAQSNLNSHTGNFNNPHKVTKDQVGLGSVDNTADADKPISNAQATAIAAAKKAGTDAKASIDNHTSNKENPHGVTAEQVGADPAGTATSAVGEHNTNVEAHNDLRIELQKLAAKVNTLLDSDDATLDQMSEVVAYIKANKDLIDAITTSKVNVSDIVDNLITNVSDRPLSAAQGVALKAMIEAITFEIDATLTKAGVAADAKATGEAIDKLSREKVDAAYVQVKNAAIYDEAVKYTDKKAAELDGEVAKKADLPLTASGEMISIQDSAEAPFQNFILFGKTIQEGELPADIDSVGEKGTVVVTVTDGTDANVRTIELSVPEKLRGVPVSNGGDYTDADGQQWVSDIIDLVRCVHTRRIGNKAFDGTEVPATITQIGETVRATFYLDEGEYAYNVDAADPKTYSGFYSHGPYTGAWETDEVHGYCSENAAILFLPIAEATSEAVQAYMAEQYAAGTYVFIQYVLANPIETALTGDELSACNQLLSYESNTTVSNDANAWMNIGCYTPTSAMLGVDFNKFKFGSALPDEVTNKELSYLSGVTAPIQEQFNGKASLICIGEYTGDLDSIADLLQNSVAWVTPDTANNPYPNYGLCETWGSHTGGTVRVQRITYTNRTVCMRIRYNGAWTEWEWDNPPIALGTEYRTTERWRGKVVYVTLLNFGALPNSSYKHVDISNLGATHILHVDATTSNGATVPFDYDTGAEVYKSYISADPDYVVIRTEWDASDQTAYVFLKYTKD